MTLTAVLLVIAYVLFIWSVKKMRRAERAAEAARLAASFHQALNEKYMTPRLSAAQIAELHAERWIGN